MLYASSLSKRIVDISEQCTVIQCLLSIHSFHPSNSISDRITNRLRAFPGNMFQISGPQPLAPGTGFVEDNFSTDWNRRGMLLG